MAALAWAVDGGDRVPRRLPSDALVAPWGGALVALVGDPEAPGLDDVLRGALGDRAGIVRYGASFLPMDEALLHAAVDISGRPFLVFNVPLRRTRISNFDLDLLEDFFRAFAFNAEITLHVNMHYGENLHHIAEATFKAVGRALAEATRLNPRIAGVLSTKGSL